MGSFARSAITVIEGALRGLSRRRYREAAGLAWQHFGAGGVEEAEGLCRAAGDEGPRLLAVPDRVPPEGRLLVRRVSETRARTIDQIEFDSPRPTGCPLNDRVHLRLIVPREGGPHRKVVLFHHSLRHDSWGFWTFFNSLVAARVPLAIVAAPHHFDRRRPGEYGGQRSACSNPWRVFEAARQWSWDQAAVQTLLREQLGLEPSASIGFSFGSFQILMTAAAGCLDMPIVAIAPTNDYGWAMTRGWIGGEVFRQIRAVGIDEERFLRMTSAARLHPVAGCLRGRPILLVRGAYDRVDPPPSIDRLRAALRPSHELVVPAGHGTLVLFRRRISAAVVEFLEEVGVLDPEPAGGSARSGRVPLPDPVEERAGGLAPGPIRFRPGIGE